MELSESWVADMAMGRIRRDIAATKPLFALSGVDASPDVLQICFRVLISKLDLTDRPPFLIKAPFAKPP
jgi:hypothetical protein